MADELQLARDVREAALATEGVYSMGAGRYAEAATYGAGEKVTGVVVTGDEVRVHIIVGYPLVRTIPEVTRNVLERVAPRVGNRRSLQDIRQRVQGQANSQGPPQ